MKKKLSFSEILQKNIEKQNKRIEQNRALFESALKEQRETFPESMGVSLTSLLDSRS